MPAHDATGRSHAAILRSALVAGSVAAFAVALLATNSTVQAAEPELALLLRGMAVIKGLLAGVAAAAVWWRLGQPVSSRAAAVYITCVWALFVCTALIWQLTFIAAAAVVFHVAGLTGLLLALREGRQMPRFGRQAPNPSIERTFQRPLRAL
ncbi:MAG: hypothetical protein ABI460_03235, partial [Caldimonas sp.]